MRQDGPDDAVALWVREAEYVRGGFGVCGRLAAECRRERATGDASWRTPQRRSSTPGAQASTTHGTTHSTALISFPRRSPSLPLATRPLRTQGVGFETFTADGPILYWNSYVGGGQMGGMARSTTPALGCSSTQTPICHTEARLPLDYQLSLRVPETTEEEASNDRPRPGACCSATRPAAPPATKGRALTDVADRARHERAVPAPALPRPRSDPAYALKARPSGQYRTTPLRGLQQHHFLISTIAAPPTAVRSWSITTRLFGLNLTAGQKADLVEDPEIPLIGTRD